MIVVTVRMKVFERDQETVIRSALSLATASRREDGNISYDFFCSAEDPELLLMLERWASMAHLEQHRKEPHVHEYIHQVDGLINERVIDLHETTPPAAPSPSA